MKTKTKTLPKENLQEQVITLCDLVLYNDDIHTFDFVIQTLMDVCGHEQVQAEQCATLVHLKGKCGVKRGSFNVLKPKCEALLEKGLSATIE